MYRQYIRDLENYLGQMYPVEVEIKDTTESNAPPSFLTIVDRLDAPSHFHLHQTRRFQYPYQKLSVPKK